MEMTDDDIHVGLKGNGDNLRIKLAIIRTIEAEKRTHLSELRTGIGILTIPMSLLTILIATSNYYSYEDVLSFIIGLVIGIICLSVVGGYLVIYALHKIRKSDRLRKETCTITEDLLRNNGFIED